MDFSNNEQQQIRKILTKRELMKEMYACKDCDCETYPWCTTLHGVCGECFDINEYKHKQALRQEPGKYAIDRNNIKNKEPTITYPYIQKVSIPPDGDCLYKSISIAYDKKIDVKKLRCFVANKQTPHIYNTYKEISKSMKGYTPIEKINNLRELKMLIKKMGKDIGIRDCMWGDENSLQILVNIFNIQIVIFNEQGRLIQTITPCDNNNTPRYIMLSLNNQAPGNEHYSLLKFNNHALLTQNEWSYLKNIGETR